MVWELLCTNKGGWNSCDNTLLLLLYSKSSRPVIFEGVEGIEREYLKRRFKHKKRNNDFLIEFIVYVSDFFLVTIHVFHTRCHQIN